MTEIKSNNLSQEIKCNELPQETVLTSTLKLLGNSDNKIRQIGVDLLRDYVNSTLQGEIDIIQNYIGNLSDLSTTQKDSLVNAVKEVDNKLTGLDTEMSNIQTDVIELNSALVNKFKVVTGTLPANSGGINLSYPSGYDKENCVVIDVAIKYNGQNWESGVGVHQQNNPQRLFASLNREEIYVHCETDTQYVLGQQCRVVLMKI